MNYYDARERTDKDGNPTGKWHYTVRNDDRIYPVGYCAQGCPGHDTPEEAMAHYRAYELDHRLRLNDYEPDVYRPCEVCGELTNKLGGVGEAAQWSLCDKHRNREEIDKLYTGPGQMISSW